jgi:adenylyltransferase/sulfurtransferase
MESDRLENIEITPAEVKAKLARGEKLTFVDVREKWEYDTSRIEGSTLIPLRSIPASLPSLQAAGEIVFFCHHGMRSLDAAAWLRSQGMEAARSMSGGIDRWSLEIDPQVPRY